MNPLIVALDLGWPEARRLVRRLGPDAPLLKIGSRLFTEAGPEAVLWAKRQGKKIFLDLKFHDIPRTVQESCRNAARLGVWGLTIHASGGFAMMKAAADSLRLESKKRRQRKPLVFGVTVLTSHSEEDLKGVGVRSPVHEQVRRLARLAKSAGLDGVVASGREISLVRRACGRDFLIVVPGVRPLRSRDDQKRVVTPAQAIRAGADYLVVGRPILEAPDPAEAARSIARSF